MSSLLVVFDDVNQRGNNLIFDYLSSEFKVHLLENKNLTSQIGLFSDAVCLFTTSIDIAQESQKLLPTFLYINDPKESCIAKPNMPSWRQRMDVFKNLAGVYVASSVLATSFLNSYRTPCRVQCPYVPKQFIGKRDFVLYNRPQPTLAQMVEAATHEQFKLLDNVADFASAKLYVHFPEPDEQWHINIMLAHSYGVPCITYRQGCFSEFCTSGDKLVSVSDSRSLINNFKIALRDNEVNSKIVYDMSQRFHAMSDLHDKIKKVLRQNNVRGTKQPTFIEVQSQAANTEALKRLQNRKTVEPSTYTQKIIRPISQRNVEFDQVFSYLSAHSNIYAGTGGIGDALLTLALAYDKPDAHIIFGASAHSREPIMQLFKVFNIDSLITGNFNGSPQGSMTWNAIFDSPNVKSCGHVPRNLDYGDWNANPKNYTSKLVTRLPLIQKFGKMLNMRNTKKVIGLAPRGSDHVSTWKQRFLTKDEYNRLVSKLLTQNATVMVFGSEADLAFYGVYPDNNVIFLNSNFAVSHPAPKYSITMKHMLHCINGCDEIISMDTWLKTYAALANIPCRVIMNRNYGKSVPNTDPSDRIFLDPSLWGFNLVPLESFL